MSGRGRGLPAPQHARPGAPPGMTLVEVIVAMAILAGVVLVLGGFSAKFAQANSQAHLVITANELAAARLDEARSLPTYAALDALATTDSIAADNTVFRRVTTVRRVGGDAAADTVDYKFMTVTITQVSMRKVVSKTTAIAAF